MTGPRSHEGDQSARRLFFRCDDALSTAYVRSTQRHITTLPCPRNIIPCPALLLLYLCCPAARRAIHASPVERDVSEKKYKLKKKKRNRKRYRGTATEYYRGKDRALAQGKNTGKERHRVRVHTYDSVPTECSVIRTHGAHCCSCMG